jgi:tripartite-type tricarboxylate transporter receptor subunit TctC
VAHFLRAGGLALSMLWAAAADAQDYPVKPIRVVVSAGAGGSTDTVARILGDKLAPLIGQQLVYDNRPGASGIIAAEIAAKAAPDGYTMLVATAGGLAVNVSLYKKLPYDPVRDFAPVTLVGSQPYMLIVHPSIPARSVAEFVRLARSAPGQLSFSHTGSGAATHLASALLESSAGLRFLSVPYKTIAGSLTAVISGEVSFTITSVFLSSAQAKAGKVRALAVTGRQRTALAPDVPTMSEAGVPGYEIVNWYGLLMPAATPSAIVSLVHARAANALARPDTRAQLARVEVEPGGSTPQEFAKFISRETAKYAALIKHAGIRAE